MSQLLKKQVLLAEDEVAIRVLFPRILNDAFPGQLDIFVCQDGMNAINLIRGGHMGFDLVISDYSMPGDKNGVDVAEVAKELSQAKTLIYSGHLPPNIHSIAEVDMALQKPLSGEELTEAVGILLGLTPMRPKPKGQ